MFEESEGFNALKATAVDIFVELLAVPNDTKSSMLIYLASWVNVIPNSRLLVSTMFTQGNTLQKQCSVFS